MKVSALILAAGMSQRFGADDKLLAPLQGKPVLAWVMDSLKGYDFHDIRVVIRPDTPAVVDLLEQKHLDYIINPKADEGMGASLAYGIAALNPCDAAFVVLGDMPLISPDLYDSMIARLEKVSADIVVPQWQGNSGHPVLFRQTCFGNLQALKGDRGGRSVIESGLWRVNYMAVDDPHILTDIDHVEGMKTAQVAAKFKARSSDRR